MNMYKTRFKDAPWLKSSSSETILLGGIGGIGSNVAYSLCKTTNATVYMLDFDKVEQHNIGTQFFTADTIGKLKSTAIRDTISKFGIKNYHTLNTRIGDTVLPISIAAFDNMTARKQMFDNWKALHNKELFVDGRLRANLYEVYAVTPKDIERYEETLFSDESGLGGDDPCTFQQSAYLAVIIGARITQVIVNYLSNKYSEDSVYTVPFMIQEVTEPFFIKTVG